ncbi:MAG: C1 family peptidase [Candidatus Eisenbacteria bacterium]
MLEAVPQIAPARPSQADDQPPGLGFVPPPGDFSHLKAPLASGFAMLGSAPPSRFDWRTTGKITPVKNQGSCGACYAFAAVANFESRVLIDAGHALDFSENNVKECEWFGSSCGGGNDWRVAHYLSTKGTVLESCDPYVASNAACTGSCTYQKTLLDWRVISGSAVPSVDVLKSYIQTYGPIYAAMYAGNRDAWYTEFQRYNGSYALYYSGAGVQNHAVLIVGWDDNLAHAGGTGAWIVKNSWGTAWGGTCGYGSERGYFTIAYGAAQIGSYSSFLYRWQDSDPTRQLLYYDEAGYTGSLGYGGKTAWGLCKFVASQDCSVEWIEFWTLDATTDVDVYIYDTFSGSAPSALLASSLDNAFDLAGYHSVGLSSPLRVSRGNDIYVVVKITDATSIYPVGFDAVGPKSPGYSYISSTGVSFMQFNNGDLGIRMRVAAASSSAPIAKTPTITNVSDVPSDRGGYVEVTWTRSSNDDQAASPRVKKYEIRRKRKDVLPSLQTLGSGTGPQVGGSYEYGPDGAAWEIVGTVAAAGQASYRFIAPTNGDASGDDTCWTHFYVTATTGLMGAHFDSPVVRGFSVDNQGGLNLPQDDLDPDKAGPDTTISRVVLNMPEPNPSSEGFLLRFELPMPDNVYLAVYDVAGRRIAVLADGWVGVGRHEERWTPGQDGTPRQVPGLYFARLVTASEVRTLKLVLTR